MDHEKASGDAEAVGDAMLSHGAWYGVQRLLRSWSHAVRGKRCMRTARYPLGDNAGTAR